MSWRTWAAAGACALALGLRPADAGAFDGQRKGFVLGFGTGAGSLVALEGSGTLTGLQTDLKIGAGVSDRVLVFYSGKQLWVSVGDALLTAALPSVAVAYYTRPSGPSPFLTGGAGVWLLGAVGSELTGIGVMGPGAFVGAGYEFGRHAALEVDAGIGVMPWDDTSFGNLAVTFSVLGY